MKQTTHGIRKRIKTARSELTAAERLSAAWLIAKNLTRNCSVHRATNIAVYLPANGEVDCRFFVETQKLRKKRVFVPILDGKRLQFAPLKIGQKLQRNRFGILEPVYDKRDLLSPRQLDVVIAPLVAFDSSCNRIGMGAGYYDRSFAFRKSRRVWRRPRLIGVAYDFQRVASIEPEPWDVPMDLVVTEQAVYQSE